tara:strand:+ start:156 stop:875 length:720 start_codon:yes stop_codon:yes gene_type:complete
MDDAEWLTERSIVTLASSNPDARCGHVEWGDDPSPCVVAGPDRVMHRSYRKHHLVGMGMRPTPRGTSICLSRYEVWFFLNGAEFTVQMVPGLGGQYQTAELDPTWTLRIPNIAIEFGWPDADTRQWLDRLNDECLIGDRLHEALHGSIVRPYKSQGTRNGLPSAKRAAVMAKTDGKCVYCAVSLTTAMGNPNSFHADHVLPVTKGGSDDIANLVPSCAQCNAKKSAKTVLTFLSGRGAP